MNEMPRHAYVYPCQIVRVIDGDTVDAEISVGFGLTTVQRLRLLDAWAPEVRGPERPAGLKAAGFVSRWVGTYAGQDDWPFRVQTSKDDAFGRWLGTIWSAIDGTCLNDALVAAGHATPTKEG